MTTTVELPDELFREAEERAASQGRPLQDLVADSLRFMLQSEKPMSNSGQSRRTHFPIVKSKAQGRVLTAEMVDAAEEHLIAEEAATHGRLAGH